MPAHIKQRSPQGRLLIKQGIRMPESDLLQANLDHPAHSAGIYCHALQRRPRSKSSSEKCLWLWVLWIEESKAASFLCLGGAWYMHCQTLAFFGDKVSLCSADQPGPFSIDCVDFEFTEICLSLLGSKVCIIVSG